MVGAWRCAVWMKFGAETTMEQDRVGVLQARGR